MKKIARIFTVAAFMASASHTALAQSADAAQGDGSGSDIVVTAARDKSLLSKTPIAMSAIGGDALQRAGVTGPAALSKVAPGISLDRTDGLQITIRGVTSTDTTEKGDPSAAFLLDGVYIARPQEADVSFFDVERVEVLRGPQGTLYGRNTTAGVVNVITNKPKIGKLEGSVDLGYGNYDAFSAQAALNIPVSSIMAIRGAVAYDRHDNYLNLAPGDTTKLGPERENFAGRLQALIEPSSNFSILLRADYAKIKGNVGSIGSYLAGVPITNFYNIVDGTPVWAGRSASEVLVRGNVLPAQPGIRGNGTTSPGMDNEAYAFEGEVNWDVGPVTVTNITSYRHFARNESNVFDVAEGTAVPFSTNNTYKQFSNELRVSTEADRPLHIQAGLYYFREREDIGQYLFGLLGPAGSNNYVFGFPQSPVINRTFAAFSQLVYKPVPSVRITAGVRYTDDYKYRYGHTVILPSVTSPLSESTGYVNDAVIKSKKVTWRAGLDADVPGGLAYASVATGYKAGGFGDGCSTGGAGESNVTSRGENCVYGEPYQPGAQAQPQAVYYQPETLTAYELGYKGKFADGAVRLNASVFYYDYKNLQLSGVVQLGSGPSTVTTNAGRAKVKGAEIEVVLSPNSNNRLNVGLDLLDAHYSEYCGHTDTSVTPFVCDDNWAGKRLDRSPTTTLRAAYTLTVPVGDGRVEGTVGTRLMSKYYVTAFTTFPVQYVTPSHTTTDVTVTYNAPNDRWYLQGYGKNLENFIAVNGVNTFGFVTSFSEPRTYGVRAGYRF